MYFYFSSGKNEIETSNNTYLNTENQEDSGSERSCYDSSQSTVHFQLPAGAALSGPSTHDTEISSCYHSASHTDNISTDEHDSLRECHHANHQLRGLHSSDSGADLSEYSHQEHTAQELEWQRYWSQHGEQIIWQSWIEKYRMYINPEYLQQNNTQSSSAPASVSQAQDVTHRNQVLIRNLSGSDSYDKLNSAQLEGWNQLSPTSACNEFEHENERLLSSRCGSVASSTAKTFATTDSMTNVTRMTVSSVDLSDSSKSSESLSSPISSVRSSASEQSSSGDPEDAMDSDQYWQILWKNHYEEQYQENFNKFLAGCLPQYSRPNVSSSPDRATRRRQRFRFEGSHVEHLLEKLAVQEGEETTKESNQSTPPIESETNSFSLGQHGLPTSFGKQRGQSSRGGDEPPEERPAVTLKRSHQTDEDPSSDRIKSAYCLIGLAHGSIPELSNDKIQGKVIYRKKHIRLQNRQLNLNRKPNKPKHLYFDESGNLITDPIDKVKMFLKSQTDEPEISNPMCISSDEDSDHSDLPTITNTPKRMMLDAAFEREDENKQPLPIFSHEYEERMDDASYIDDIEIFGNPNDNDYFGVPNVSEQQTVKKKERKKKKKNNRFLNNVPSDIREDPIMMKYWFKRFSLFSKFDQGITLDRGELF